MPKTWLHGQKVYKYPDEVTEILFNGNSVLDLAPEEVAVFPDGYGWVLVRKLDSADEIKQLIDGSYMHYILRGQVEVTV